MCSPVSHRRLLAMGPGMAWHECPLDAPTPVLGIPGGNLYTMGGNHEGQLGTGDYLNRSSPTLVGAGVWVSGTVTIVAAGQYFTVVVAGVCLPFCDRVLHPAPPPPPWPASQVPWLQRMRRTGEAGLGRAFIVLEWNWWGGLLEPRALMGWAHWRRWQPVRHGRQCGGPAGHQRHRRPRRAHRHRAGRLGQRQRDGR